MEKVVSQTGTIVKSMRWDEITQIVISQSPRNEYEFGIVKFDHVYAESAMTYSDVVTALSDATIYLRCGKVLFDGSQGKEKLCKATIFEYEHDEQPELTKEAWGL